jgi:hypothetical protein
MPTNESLRQTLDHYRGQEKQLLADLQTVRLMITRLERDLGEPPSGAESQVNLSDSLPLMGERVEITNGRKPEIRPDEFFGMTQAEAARKYLKRIGHAISFDDLVAALQAGGCRVGGDNPKKVLYISLVRNTRDFVPPQQGYIGLREFYPGGGGASRSLREKPKPTKKQSRSKKATKKQAKSKASKTKEPPIPARQPSPVGEAVRAVLADKQARSVDEIVAGVTAKVGNPVKKIAVLGVLSNKKGFEKVDGKFRAVK